MFRNLEAEQGRYGYNNQKVADLLGISRVSYERKKRTGKFIASECKKLCELYNCDFKYLFAIYILEAS